MRPLTSLLTTYRPVSTGVFVRIDDSMATPASPRPFENSDRDCRACSHGVRGRGKGERVGWWGGVALGVGTAVWMEVCVRA